MTDAWLDEVITETAVAQGLPFFADDPGALDRTATILAAAAPSAGDGMGDGNGAGSTRRGHVRGSTRLQAARAGQPSGSSAPARSKDQAGQGTA